MKLIVGLGNPGKRYQGTRHNLGFSFLDELARKENLVWRADAKRKVNRALWRSGQKKIFLVKPQTMMNQSGSAAARFFNFYCLKPENLWVVHDDLDLPLGQVKIQKGRGPAGHKGVASVIQKLKTKNFNRIRLGIGHPENKEESEKYVLSKFSSAEKETAEKMIQEAIKAMTDNLENSRS